MFLLGLLLAAGAAAFAALLIAYNTSGGPEYTVGIFNTDLVTLNSLAIFCSGLALGLIFSLGLLMMGGKARLNRARRNHNRRAVVDTAARERAVPAEARADRRQHEPPATDEAGTTWTADPAHQPQTGGSHRRTGPEK
ncbi:hypothetical protein [Embleya sp. AB8]|uniref:hypothetical protein n=1 Tax=Embleya sp. AB8 TaxID=3156304 RepID=UPI003C781A0D